MGCAIDWDATGSMLSGIAAWLAVGAIVWAAKQGRDAVADWRAQKQEERKLHTAEAVLTVAYRIRRSLKDIRANFITAAELETAEEKLKEHGIEFEKKRADRLKTAQAILNRITYFRKDYDALFEIMPTAEAYFGDAVSAPLEAIAKIWNGVAVSASMYGEDEWEPDFEKELRAEIWAGLQSKKGLDPVAAGIQENIGALEKRLIPLIRGAIQ